MKITTLFKRFDRGAATALSPLPTSARLPFLLALLLVSLLALAGRAAELAATPAGPDFGNMSLDQLMNYPVTSPTKHEGKLSETPAAIEVITQEDIRRSGVTSIPEALRMAPGLEVAKVDAHTWAISSRGFNDVFANKLLVLQDGRSVYTPLFSGVFWDVQDTLLEDIDRIEVIRGPGAALWGANAVNGVINIITKKASDTQGLLIAGGAGTEERGFGGFRYGGKAGENLYFRLYGKYFDRDDSVFANGASAADAWHMGREGFRMDWVASAENLVTLQGDFYSGTANQIFTNATPSPTPPFIEAVRDQIELTGGNVLGRWSHNFSADSEAKLQLYYDRTSRDTAIFKETRDTFDLDSQHRFPLGDRNDVSWGAGYRLAADRVGSSFTIALNPDHRTTQLLSTFVQDEITLVRDRLRLTLGSKFEHNDFTGFEIQPSGRLSWIPTERQTVWASVSRAVRTPSRAEDDIRLVQLTPNPVVFGSIQGSRSFESEKLTAYELGYRLRPHSRVSLDLALFYNAYDDLRSIEPGGIVPGPPGLGTVPATLANKLHGETYGAEFAPSWQATDWWRLQAAYTYLQMQLHRDPGSGDTTSESNERRSPRHQFSLRSVMDLPYRVQFDWGVRYVDSLPAINVASYVTMDARLGWRPTQNLELSLVGQNLLANRHAEFRPSSITTQATEVERSVYGRITLRF